MIPVISNNYEIFDLNKIPDNDDELKRINLLKSQVLWLNKNKKNVYKKAISLYDKYIHNRLNERIKKRCCNFVLLEEKSKDYNKIT